MSAHLRIYRGHYHLAPYLISAPVAAVQRIMEPVRKQCKYTACVTTEESVNPPIPRTIPSRAPSLHRERSEPEPAAATRTAIELDER